MVRASPVPLTYHLPALHGVDSLHRTREGLLGLVILGSGASPLDDEPWQTAFDAWLLPTLAADVPALGLCYGHQHIAHRLGGEVGFVHDDQRKLRGIREIELEPNRLWGSATRGPMVISHREMVTRLPEGFQVTASSPDVPIDAYHHPSRPIWGFQPHPEATIAFTENNGIPFDAPEQSLSFGHGLVDAFLQFAADHR
jgi:GMP synthase-like glutamine amidotransferase